MEIIPLQTTDGVSSELRVRRSADTSRPLVFILPAMGVAARQYDALAEALAKRNLSSIIVEPRGLGSSSIRASRKVDFGYFEMTEFDVPAALGKSAELFPHQTPVVFGHSLGGQLACLSLAQSPESFHKLILCASCAVDFRGWDFPVNLGLLLFTQLSALIARLCGYFPGHKLGFGGRTGRRVILDWARNSRTGNYVLENSQFDYEQNLPAVQADILAINFEHDKFAPPTATQKLLDKLGPISVTRKMITADQLGAKPADHFRFLRHPEKIAELIESWLLSAH